MTRQLSIAKLQGLVDSDSRIYHFTGLILFINKWPENLMISGMTHCKQVQVECLLNLTNSLFRKQIGSLFHNHNGKVMLTLVSDYNIIVLSIHGPKVVTDIQPKGSTRNLSKKRSSERLAEMSLHTRHRRGTGVTHVCYASYMLKIRPSAQYRHKKGKESKKIPMR